MGPSQVFESHFGIRGNDFTANMGQLDRLACNLHLSACQAAGKSQNARLGVMFGCAVNHVNWAGKALLQRAGSFM
jgi:hypothetical protein